MDAAQISLNSTLQDLETEIIAWIFVMPVVQSCCLQPKLDLQVMFKINLTNYGGKLTLGKTHKQPRPMFPTIAGNMSVCLLGGGL